MTDEDRYSAALIRSNLEPEFIALIEQSNLRSILKDYSQNIESIRQFGNPTKEQWNFESVFLKAALRDTSLYINEFLTSFKLTEHTNINDVLLGEGGMNLDRVPPAFKILIEKAILTYFDRIDNFIKKDILAGYIEVHPDDQQNAMKITLICLMNSGPILQKLIQLASDNFDNPDIKIVLQALKNNIRRMTPEELHQSQLAAFSNQISKMFVSFDKTAIAAASVGQVHSAYIKSGKHSQREVIVKLKRFRVDVKLSHEYRFLDLVQEEDPTLKGYLEDVKAQVAEELDYAAELRNLVLGAKYYESKRHGILVVGALGAYPPVLPSAIVMEKAEGKALTDIDGSITPRDICTLLSRLHTFLGLWFWESLLGSGFFHGDGHAGNLYFDKKSKALTIIDFGNSDIVAKEYQMQLINFMIGITLKEPKTVLEGLGRGLRKSCIDFSDFLSKFPPGTFDDSPEGLLKLTRAKTLHEERVWAKMTIEVEKTFESTAESARNETKLGLTQRQKLVRFIDPSSYKAKLPIDPFNAIIDASAKEKIRLPQSFVNWNRGRILIEKNIYAIEKIRIDDEFLAQRTRRCKTLLPMTIYKRVLLRSFKVWKVVIRALYRKTTAFGKYIIID